MIDEPLAIVERLLGNVPRVYLIHVSFDLFLALMIIAPRILYVTQALLLGHTVIGEAVDLYRHGRDIELKQQVQRTFWLGVNSVLGVICLDKGLRLS